MDGPKAEILVEEGTEAGRVLSLRPSKTIELGREGNFRLDDPSLSRRHCTISFNGSGYSVEDQGSTWGTFVNGSKITSHSLRNGDRIKVGSHVMLFSIETPAAPAPAEMTIQMAPAAAPAEQRYLEEDDDDDIPSAPAAPTAAPGSVHPPPAPRLPPAAPPLETLKPEEPVPPLGTCANCGKTVDDDEGGRWETESVGMAPRSYCTNCREQYPLLGKVLANHFCDKVLGAGGMGIVYRGTHVVMGRMAALKTLKVMAEADPVLVQRLLREATAGGRIQHPNIVSVHDTGEQNQIAYVVMEYVRGENLGEAMRREKKFTLRRAIHFGAQVAEALAAGFKLGYIHRDIKPENILLMPNDMVKVTDFGLAKNLKEGELGGLTRTGQVLGTMLYMPPEQIVSSKGSDQRADIYSLGATMFHFATGRPPLDAKSAIKLLMDIRTKEPPSLSSLVEDCPPEVDRILTKCLKKDPGERYQEPADLAKDLRAVLATL